METYVSDFETDIEFERFVLAKLVPTISLAHSSTTATLYLDGRPTAVEMHQTLTLGMSAADFVTSSGLQPILFGAAWKIIDVLIEHSLSQNHATRKVRYTIAEKVASARSGSFVADPFRSLPLIWSRLCAAYINAEEYRHSVSHRRVTVDAAGAFVGVDRTGAAMRPLSVDEQVAFCKVVQRIATCVISGTIDTREEAILRSLLDELAALTGLPAGSRTVPAASVPIITFPTLKTAVVSMVDVKSKVLTTFPTAQEADIIFEITDDNNLRFFARLEDIPDISFVFDVNLNEPWLIRI